MDAVHELALLRGAIVNGTYGTHKTLYISLFLPTIFVPVDYDPPSYCNGLNLIEMRQWVDESTYFFTPSTVRQLIVP